MGRFETIMTAIALVISIVYGLWEGLAHDADDPGRLAAPGIDRIVR